MVMRKLVFFLLALFFLMSCGKEEEKSGRDIILGFSQLGSESAWRNAETESIKSAARKGNIQLMFFDAQQKQENQIKHIRSLIAFQVDVIAFSPIVATGWDNVLKEARKAGIPVILVDRGIKSDIPDLYDGEVGYDVIEEGRRAARYLKKKFPTSSQREINIFELRGTDNSTPTEHRHRGFVEELSDDPRFNITHSRSGDFMTSRGYEIIYEELGRPGHGIDVLFSHNDSMTLGALDAMDDLGIVPGEDIIIITFDAEQKAVDQLVKGRINCVVECNPILGETLINTARILARGGSVPRKTFVEEGVFTEFTPALEDLPPRGY